MSIELPNLGAKPNDLKISNVYKITNPDKYERLNLIFADKPKELDEDSLFTFAIDGEPLWVKHQSGNTYNVDDHRQGTKFPPITTAITIDHDPVASAETVSYTHLTLPTKA